MSSLMSIVFALLMGFGLSFIPSATIIAGPLTGLALIFLMIVTKTTKLLPLVQGALVLLCNHNPLFTYMVLGAITGSKMLLSASRSINTQSQVEGVESGVIGNSLDDINTQWSINYLWTTAILLGTLGSGIILGTQVITGFGQLLLMVSLFVSPFMWGLYIHQLEKEERVKFILGGVLSCILLLLSVVGLFKGSMLGMLVPFVLLAISEGNGVKKNTEFKVEQLDVSIGITNPKREVMWYVLASGIFRALFIFFGGSLLVHMINKQYAPILSDKDKFINHCHSEAIGEALQPVMLWGYLLSRGDMDAFSQLGLSYILSMEELFILILLIVGVQAIFFLMRKDILTWLVNEPMLDVSIKAMGIHLSLDQVLVLGITLILSTVIMGNILPTMLMISLTIIYKVLVKALKLPGLSQGMSTTFVPIGLYILG